MYFKLILRNVYILIFLSFILFCYLNFDCVIIERNEIYVYENVKFFFGILVCIWF